jgi:hypothetical protein
MNIKSKTFTHAQLTEFLCSILEQAWKMENLQHDTQSMISRRALTYISSVEIDKTFGIDKAEEHYKHFFK